jgi:hypothetical protein
MKVKVTTDIWFASFLKLKEYQVINFDVLPKSKGRFYFNISDEDWKKLKLEFDASAISKIKMHQIALKDMLH